MESYENHFRFDGKTFLVTGAASGLGREIVRAFARFGAALLIADIDSDGLALVADELHTVAREVRTAVADVSDPAAVEAMVADAVAISGTLDAVVHCAGIGGRAPAEDYPLDLFDRVMAVNAGGTFLVSQAAGRVMLKQEKGGAIVNLSSIGGVVGKAGSVGYQTSKAMEIQIAKSLGVE